MVVKSERIEGITGHNKLGIRTQSCRGRLCLALGGGFAEELSLLQRGETYVRLLVR